MLKDFEEEDREAEEKQRKHENNLVASTQASIVDDAVAKMRAGVPPLPGADDEDGGMTDWEKRAAEKFEEAKRAELEAQRSRSQTDEKMSSPFVKMSSDDDGTSTNNTTTTKNKKNRQKGSSSKFSMNLSPKLVRADVRKIGTSKDHSSKGPRTRNEIMYDAWKKRHLKEIEKESSEVHNRVFHKKGEDYDREVLEKALLKSGTHRHDTMQWRTDMSWLAHIRPDFQKDHPSVEKKKKKKKKKEKTLTPKLNEEYNKSHHIHSSLDDHADMNRFKSMPSEHDMDIASMARRYAHGERVLPAAELPEKDIETKSSMKKSVVFEQQQSLNTTRKEAVSRIIRNKYYPKLQSTSLYRNHLNRSSDDELQHHAHEE